MGAAPPSSVALQNPERGSQTHVPSIDTTTIPHGDPRTEDIRIIGNRRSLTCLPTKLPRSRAMFQARSDAALEKERARRIILSAILLDHHTMMLRRCR